MPIYPYSFTMPPVNKQDIPSDGVVGEFLGISAGGVLDWLPVAGGGGGGDMLKADNLSGLADYAIARTNIGLGTGNSPQFTGIQFSTDTFIIRGGAANLQLGAADAAAPVAQTLSVQSVVAGTTNTAGADFTIDGSQGTGTGAGGKIIFRVARAGTSGSTQNILTTGLSIDPTIHPNGGLGISSVGGNNLFLYYPGNGGIFFGDIYSNIYGGFSGVGNFRIGNDAFLLNEATNTLALRNGAAAQTFRVYNTYTDASNFERAIFSFNSNRLEISTGQAGAGVSRKIDFGTNGATGITFFTNTTNRWGIGSDGHFVAAADNTYDIGASGANRPKNVYVVNSIVSGFIVDSQYFRALSSGGFQVQGRFYISSTADGNITLTNNGSTDFSLLQLGGTTNVFPAIARDGAGIKFTGAAAGSTAWIKVPPVAVSALPLAATAGAGARAFVNDASSPTFGSAVTGGGAVLVPVYSTGSAWHVG